MPKANKLIEAKKVRLIDADGEMQGVVSISEALDFARSKGLDLVEISPNAEPPVCKLLDFGKYKFGLQKKNNNQKKKQVIVHLKEVKFRPNIDEHDYQVKLRSVNKFLSKGDRVKISLRFRGREITRKEIGMDLMQRIVEDTVEIAKIDSEAKMDGRQILMMLAPKG